MNGLKAPAGGAAIQDHLSALADPTRTRILLCLERHELTVTELCTVLQLPQSTVSRHLRALAESGWVVSRSEGTSNLYSIPKSGLDPAGQRLWAVVRDHVDATPAATQDERRLRDVLIDRRTKSQEFFASSAGQWDRLRDELFGRQFHLGALLGLLDDSWTVGDLGCGTGRVAASIAPFVSRVVAIDGSAAMLQAARRRLRDVPNAELRRGELEALPIDDGSLDAATLILVLHHVVSPSSVLTEVARVLKPGGRLLVTDMLPHDRESYRQHMGHVWLGFSHSQVEQLMTDASFERFRMRPLPSDPEAKGPTLFAATAWKADGDRNRSHA
jgi:ArsR family transcriptional regulator